MKKMIIMAAIMFAGLQLSAQQDIKPPKVEASYTGGSEAMNTFITKSLKYPAKSAVQGKVYVEFLIDATGKVGNARVLKGIDPALDKLALDVVLKMPDWTPAKDEKGTAIPSKMVLPINFKK